MWEVSCASVAAPLHGEAGGDGVANFGTNALTLNFTTTVTNTFLVVVTTDAANCVEAKLPQTGWTMDFDGAETGGVTHQSSFQHLIVSSTGTYHGETLWTNCTDAHWAIAFAAFK